VVKTRPAVAMLSIMAGAGRPASRCDYTEAKLSSSSGQYDATLRMWIISLSSISADESEFYPYNLAVAC